MPRHPDPSHPSAWAPLWGEGLARASPLRLRAGVQAARAAVGRPGPALAHVVRGDLIVDGAEDRARLVTCGGQAAVGGGESAFKTEQLLWARHRAGHRD